MAETPSEPIIDNPVDQLHVDFWACLMQQVERRADEVNQGIAEPNGLTYEEAIEAWTDMMVNGPPF